MSHNKKFEYFLIIIILCVQNKITCNPVQNSDNNDTNDEDLNGDDNNSVTEHSAFSSAGIVTRPNTRIIDLNNLDESHLEFLRNNNINLTALREQQGLLRAQKKTRISHIDAPAPLTQTRNPNRDEDQYRRE